jgi:hypothetical protein
MNTLLAHWRRARAGAAGAARFTPALPHQRCSSPDHRWPAAVARGYAAHQDFHAPHMPAGVMFSELNLMNILRKSV